MAKRLSEEELYARAEKRADDLVGFFVHAVVYVAVNVGLWALDLITGGGVDWAYWTTIPWGIGLAIHGLLLLLELKPLGEQWRRRRIERYVDRNRDSTKGSGST